MDPLTCLACLLRLVLFLYNGRQDLCVTSVKAPPQSGAFAFSGGIANLPQSLISAMNPARLSSYEAEWARIAAIPANQVSRPAAAALYVWQVSLNSAWYETLAYTEAIVRNAVDLSLRTWNVDQGHSRDWLSNPAVPLASLVSQSASRSAIRANQAAQRRGPTHPRYGVAVSFDDQVAQLDFGSIAHLFPKNPPQQRSQNGSGYNARENMWIYALKAAFPRLTPALTQSWQGQLPQGLPPAVQDAYAVGLAIDRLRRLRNRIGHHEQTFQVQHTRRLKDVSLLLRGISHGPAEELRNLDRVRRTLSMRPHP